MLWCPQNVEPLLPAGTPPGAPCGVWGVKPHPSPWHSTPCMVVSFLEPPSTFGKPPSCCQAFACDQRPHLSEDPPSRKATPNSNLLGELNL